MTDKNKKRSLAREGEPSQKTEKGLEIPVPTKDDFFGLLAKATKKKESREKPSRSGQE
jgi:hypothetical protein